MKTIGGDSEGADKKKKRKDEELLESINTFIKENPEKKNELFSATRTNEEWGINSTTPFFVTNEKGELERQFNPNPRMTQKDLQADNIKSLTLEEASRRMAMTPEQRYAEDREKEYAKGEYGKFSEQELTARLKAEGKNVYEGEATPLQPKGALDKVAEFGVAIPTAVANLIGRGLRLAGVKEAEAITPEQFVSTDIGKFLGVAITGAEAAGVLSFGSSLLGAGGVKGLMGANIIKSGLSVKGTLAGLAGAGVISSKIIADAKGAVNGTIQTAGLINDAVQLGQMSPTEAILSYDDLNSQLLELEGKIQSTSYFNPVNWLSGGKDNLVDIANAKLQLQIKRQMLLSAMQPQNI
jgi:hypothetical protein